MADGNLHLSAKLAVQEYVGILPRWQCKTYRQTERLQPKVTFVLSLKGFLAHRLRRRLVMSYYDRSDDRMYGRGQSSCRF